MRISLRTLLLGSLFAASFSGYAFGQDADDEAVQETVVVTGARGVPRSVTDSPVPVDVIGEDEITAVSFVDTNDVLKTLVPSYSLSRQPISDGGTFVRPATLRGLPTDKTLVLVNSKRRHRAALVQIGGSGTQGPDISTIPASALKTVEVLRDGAAAQYGSDAIAGVINFLLKDNAEGGSFSAQAGQFYEGDGTQYLFTGNIGIPLGPDGFLSVSGEYSDSEATTRANQYCEDFACVDINDPRFGNFDTTIDGYTQESFLAGLDAANIGPGDVVQPWGQPNSEGLRLFYNAGYDLGFAELYSFGNYSESEADGGFFYRYPGNGTIENLRLEDGSVWSPLRFFPGGFTPRFFGEVTDYSVVGGIKGLTDSGFGWDISGRFGSNEISYTLKNTVNPSMGPDSPTSFEPGDLINEELQLQADFSQEFEMGLASPLLFAFGASYLDESYELVGGEPDSYLAGPFAGSDPFGFCTAPGGTPTAAGLAVIATGSSLDCSDPSDPAFTVVGVGSNGFPGYSPAFSGEYTRDSYGVYTDVSADVTDALFLQGALRYEDYSDFGSELVWKLAGRYEFTPAFAMRGSVGTGFRAPTPGQQGTTNVSTRLPNGIPVATGLFPASGPVAQALGAEELKPEKSTNYSLGFTGNVGDFGLTVDFYQIELEDRVNAISTRDVSADPTAGDAYLNYLALVDAGVAGAETIGGVFYFANAFDTTTQGVDVVGTYNQSWGGGASTAFTASVNYNQTEFDGDVSGVFNAEDTYDFENGTPNWRGVFSANTTFGDFSILGRANYYGAYDNSDSGGAAGNIQDLGATVQFDLEGTYQFSDMLRFTVGARNILDEYPDKADPAIGDSCCGRIYYSDSVVDWQGGFYYAKVTAEF